METNFIFVCILAAMFCGVSIFIAYKLNQLSNS